MIKTLNQFIDWYVGRLTTSELKQAIEETGISGKGMSVAEARQRLRTRWKDKRAKKVAQYFESLHQQARSELNQLNLVERRGAIDRFIADYGVRETAYLFVVSPDDSMREKGLDLINRRGGEVPPAVDAGPLYPETESGHDHQEEATTGEVVTKTESAAAVLAPQPDPVGLLEQAAIGLRTAAETGEIIIDSQRLGSTLRELNELWEKMEDSLRQHDLALIKESLAALSTTYAPVLHYYKLGEIQVPAADQAIPTELYSHLKELLLELCQLCQEALQWQQMTVTDLDEDRKRMEQVFRLQGDITTRYQEIVSILGPPGGGPDRGHHQTERPEAEQSGNDVITGSAAIETVKPGDEAESGGPIPGAENDSEGDTAVSGIQDREQAGDITITDDQTTVSSEVNPEVPVEPVAEKEISPPEPEPIVAPRESQPEARMDRPEGKVPVTAETDITIQIWKAVTAQELATAYWLAREAEHKESGSFPPSWLLLAAQLGLEAGWDGEREKELFRQMIIEHEEELGKWDTDRWAGGDLALFLTAIALRPALLAPETMARALLQQASVLVKNPESYLARLINLVMDFSSYGKINSGMLQETLNEEDWKRKILGVVDSVNHWCRETRSRRLSFAPATEVLCYFTSPGSCLKEVLDIVTNNRYDQVQNVEKVLHDWLDGRKEMVELVHQTTKACFTSNARAPIVGVALDQLIRTLQELKSCLKLWVETVHERNDQNRSNNWLYQQTQAFREDFVEYSHLLQESWHGAVTSEAGLAISSYAGAVLGRIATNTLHIRDAGEVPQFRDWSVRLTRPLLLLEEAPIDEESLEADLTAPFDCSMMEAIVQGRTLEQAFRLHLDHRDFLLAWLVVQELRDEGNPRAEELASELRDREAEARLLLKERLDYVRNMIVQATLDHILSEERRSAEEGRLLSIEGQSTKRCYLQFQELEQIQDELDSLRRERQNSLHQHIEALAKELQQSATSPLQEQSVRQYLEQAKEALQRKDLPIADELLLYAEEALDTGQSEDIAGRTKEINYVEEFVKVCDGLNQYLESSENRNPKGPIELLAKGKSIAGLDMRRVPGARHQEIKMGLEAWLALKRYNHSARQQPQLAKPLTQLMEYVGFQQPQVKCIKGDNQSAYFSARMSAGTLSPLADFGSLRQNQYELILVYSRPSDVVIGQILQEYGVTDKSPLVIFLGRLTGQQRREWSNYCRAHNLTALMMDEILIYYLASQRESRLPALISCGVAWGYEMPYLSFGVIPPEIFKGRSSMARELADGLGSCIVYGGRQFGKSVLLRMVQLQYDNPDQGVIVIYDDIKPFGDPQGYLQPSDLWSRLRDLLVDRKLLNPAVGELRDNVSRKLIERLERDTSLRVILLLDEADNFLAADARQNFEELLELRRMMDQTRRRFKVVFCGLHSVQRYCSGENHPFAQMMARPLVVGPLEPRAARALIVEPMSAIGFTFDDQEAANAVLRILCYTNYHPALIQYFCGEVVKLVRRRLMEPPYRITVQDVEGVYRREDVRSFMRERFNWTLELDQRYKVIVYTMIFEQLQERDGYREEFTAPGILDKAQQFWSEGFTHIRLDEVKSLLEELIGLGVLVKRISGKYRLRNGNIVRALGSEQEIWDRMNDMMSQPPPTTHDDAVHFRLKLPRRQRSPLTCKQVTELTRMSSGVGLVFGNQALGLNRVAATLQYVVKKGSKAVCSPLPPELVTTEQFVKYFDNQLKRKGCRDYYYSDASSLIATGVPLVEVVGAVSSSLSSRRHRNSMVHWVLLFDAEAADKWFRADNWQEAESQAASISYLQRWDQRMIRQYLDDMDLLSTQLVIDKIDQVTGGWPYLLEVLWGLIRKNSQGGDPQAQVENLKEQLQDRALKDKFIEALEIDSIPYYGREMIGLFRDLGPLDWENLSEGIAAYGNPKLAQLSPAQQRGIIRVLLCGGLLLESDHGLKAEPVVAGVLG